MHNILKIYERAALTKGGDFKGTSNESPERPLAGSSSRPDELADTSTSGYPSREFVSKCLLLYLFFVINNEITKTDVTQESKAIIKYLRTEIRS